MEEGVTVASSSIFLRARFAFLTLNSSVDSIARYNLRSPKGSSEERKRGEQAEGGNGREGRRGEGRGGQWRKEEGRGGSKGRV